MSLTKASLIESIAKENGFSRPQSDKIVDTVFKIMKRELERGEDVLISRFGKFCIKNKSSRRGRNPQTGEEMMLPSRKVVRFQYSQLLMRKLNEGHDRTLTRTRKKR